jgi:APA family basic amino acid/polyamine antiporter
VAVGWSGYVVSFLKGLKINGVHVNWLDIPPAFTSAPYNHVAPPDAGWNLWRLFTNGWVSTGAVLNVPAMCIVAIITVLLVIGIKESATFNNFIVAIKLIVILAFIAIGAAFINPANWHPFVPPAISPGHFGWSGVLRGAGVIFFAYIGFDAVSTAAEETRNPQRNVPIGIIASLILCTVIYVAVALVLTGMVKWDQFTGVADPLSKAFSVRGMNWTAGIISFGAVFATTSVLIVFQLGQPRIFFSIARDGLLPPWAAKVHPKYRTPYITTILTGVFVAVFAAVTNIDEVVDLCNIGTLFAFVLVAAGILVLRRTDPGRPRPFRTPLVPWVPLLAILTCGYLMAAQPRVTWIRFVVWLFVGLVLYFCYGYRRSRVGIARAQALQPPGPRETKLD